MFSIVFIFKRNFFFLSLSLCFAFVMGCHTQKAIAKNRTFYEVHSRHDSNEYERRWSNTFMDHEEKCGVAMRRKIAVINRKTQFVCVFFLSFILYLSKCFCCSKQLVYWSDKFFTRLRWQWGKFESEKQLHRYVLCVWIYTTFSVSGGFFMWSRGKQSWCSQVQWCHSPLSGNRRFRCDNLWNCKLFFEQIFLLFFL